MARHKCMISKCLSLRSEICSRKVSSVLLKCAIRITHSTTKNTVPVLASLQKYRTG
jgi:hypothetical protein